MPKNEINIGNGRAVIYENDYGVWQFRVWLADENKYFRKSLRQKNREEAIRIANELWEDISYEKRKGKKFYGITVEEAVEKYLQHRKQEVGLETDEGIVEGRWNTIRTHLKHFVAYLNRGETVRTLGKTALLNYERDGVETSYVVFRQTQGIAIQTIRNELATINACWKYLYETKEQYANFPSFNIPKLKIKKYDKSGVRISRQTFTREEWKKYYKALETYAAKKYNNDYDYLDKQLVRHSLLFMANCGARSGELRQLRWRNIAFEEHKGVDNKVYLLARVLIEEHTTKVREPRIFYTIGGKYLMRWKEILKKLGRSVSEEDLVFSRDGKTEYSNTMLVKHFRKVLNLTDIDLERKQNLVPYSLRHLFVSNQFKAGASFELIAHHCGTSVVQIERTYAHISDEQKRAFATMRYIERDGNIVATTVLDGD
jgi:integrase